MMYDEIYISLSSLSVRLGLPETYLKNLAKNGDIPYLNIKGRFKFNPDAVQQALDKLAEQGENNGQ
jgi:hypothetical protein